MQGDIMQWTKEELEKEFDFFRERIFTINQKIQIEDYIGASFMLGSLYSIIQNHILEIKKEKHD